MVAADFNYNYNGSFVFYSERVNDSFEIFISLPVNLKKDESASIVVYLDANLELGEQIRSKHDVQSGNTIFVGIGHTGNYRLKRRRDFISPQMVNGVSIESNTTNYGHADKFYRFLEDELIPYINSTYSNNGVYSLIGHSLSGLFVYYALLQDTLLFKNYVALSPSLWVNHSNIFEYENQFFETYKTLDDVSLYHSWGGLEVVNKVRPSSRKMQEVMELHKYLGVCSTFYELPNKGHNNSVGISLNKIFKQIKF